MELEERSAAQHSLRRRMLWRVLLPLALTWLLGSAISITVAYIFAAEAFDRSLLDDAYDIAANVSTKDGGLVLNLSPHEVETVLFDQSEKTFFAVFKSDGSLLAGNGALHAQPAVNGRDFAFDERRYLGLDLRAVTLRQQEPLAFVVVVAQTTPSRSQLLRQLLVNSVVPQAILLLLLGLWLGRSIRRELEPLSRLQQALQSRDTGDLTPVQLEPTSGDIGRLAGAINALMSRIDAGVRAQREFAGNIAHELRTPLAGIRSLAEYGLMQKDPALWQAQLRNIVQSEQRASRLVDQLLALALADEARDSLKLEAVAVDVVVRDVLLRQMPRADAAGVDLGAQGLEQPLLAMADVALLEGLLANLVDNALRHGRPAAHTHIATTLPNPVPHVTVEVTPQGAEVLLTVTDNGPGLDGAQRQRVLARWEQGAAALQRGSGSGLGLAIVSRYVALLGGRFELVAAPGGVGLQACVWLVRAPAA